MVKVAKSDMGSVMEKADEDDEKSSLGSDEGKAQLDDSVFENGNKSML